MNEIPLPQRIELVVQLASCFDVLFTDTSQSRRVIQALAEMLGSAQCSLTALYLDESNQDYLFESILYERPVQNFSFMSGEVKTHNLPTWLDRL